MNTTNSTHNPHWHPDTQAIRQSLPRSQYNEHSEALYLTSSFVQPDASTCAHNFAHPEDGYTYSRTGNPTVSSFEQRLSALEQAPATVATASGMSAILALCMGLLKAGDHIVCSQSMFGSTISLLGNIMARFGVQASFVAQTRTSDWQAAIRPNTRLLFAETPTNPSPTCATSPHSPTSPTTQAHCSPSITASSPPCCNAPWRSVQTSSSTQAQNFSTAKAASWQAHYAAAKNSQTPPSCPSCAPQA